MSYKYKYIKYKNKYLQLKENNIKYIGGNYNKPFIKNTVLEKYMYLQNKYKSNFNNIVNIYFVSINYCSLDCSNIFKNKYLKNIFNKKIKKILKYNFINESVSIKLINIINKYNINIDNISLIISNSFMLEAILYLYEFKKNNMNYNNIYTYIINKSTQSKEYTDILNKLVLNKNIKNSKYELKDFIKLKDNIIKDTIIIDYNSMDYNTNQLNILNIIYHSLKQLNKNGDIIIYIRIINSKYYYDIFNYIGTFFNKINIHFNKFNETLFFYIIYKNYKGISTKQYNELHDIINGKKKVPITNEVEFNKFKNDILLREKEVLNNYNIIEKILENNDMGALQDYFLINFTNKLKYYKSLNLEIVDWLDNDNIPTSYYNNKINDIYIDNKPIKLNYTNKKSNLIKYKTKKSLDKYNNNLLNKIVKLNHLIYAYNYNDDEMILLDSIIKEQNKLFKMIKSKYVNSYWCYFQEIFNELNFFKNIKNINIMFMNELNGNIIDSCIYYLNKKKKKYSWFSQSLKNHIIIDKKAFSNINKKKWDYGIKNGNINDINNIIYYKNKYSKVNVIISNDDKINASNILSSLYILNKGGNIIFKINHINTDKSYLIILSMFNKFFNKVVFYKSTLSTWNNDTYLVAINYKGFNYDILSIIKDYNGGKKIKDIYNTYNSFINIYHDISTTINEYYQKNMVFIYFLISNENIYKLFYKEINSNINNFILKWKKKYI